MTRFIVCRQCHKQVQVKTPTEQRRRKFCSRSCAGKQHIWPAGSQSKGGIASRTVRRKKVIERYKTLTFAEALRVEFIRGYNAGYRRGRREQEQAA